MQDRTRTLLHELTETAPFLHHYTLVGGSALALYLKHRKSEDLDFFTYSATFEPEQILTYCGSWDSLKILNKSDEQLEQIREKVPSIKKQLEEKGLTVKFDDRDTHKPGWKFSKYELKGIPVRLAIGPRDLENNTIEVARRDTMEKEVIQQEQVVEYVANLMTDIQNTIYNKALKFRENNTYKTDDYEEFKDILNNKGGFVEAHWDGTSETEEKIKEDTKATIRCVPVEGQKEEGKCIVTGKPSKQRVVFARAY